MHGLGTSNMRLLEYNASKPMCEHLYSLNIVITGRLIVYHITERGRL